MKSVEEFIRTVFAEMGTDLPENMAPVTIKSTSLDSLDLYGLLLDAEDEFGIALHDDAVHQLKTVGDLANYLNEARHAAA